MVENVQTGGLMSFRHDRNVAKASAEEKREIADAYNRYYERKAKDRTKKAIIWILVALIVLFLVGAYIYSKQ